MGWAGVSRSQSSLRPKVKDRREQPRGFRTLCSCTVTSSASALLSRVALLGHAPLLAASNRFAKSVIELNVKIQRKLYVCSLRKRLWFEALTKDVSGLG